MTQPKSAPAETASALDKLKHAVHGSVETEAAALRALGFAVERHSGWWGHLGYRDPNVRHLQGLPGITTDAGRAIRWIERYFPARHYWLSRGDGAIYTAQIGNDPKLQVLHSDATLALAGALLKAAAVR
jgi:hypothetical protein